MMKAQFVPAWQSGSRALGVDQLHLNPEHGLTKAPSLGLFCQYLGFSFKSNRFVVDDHSHVQGLAANPPVPIPDKPFHI